MNPDHGSPKWTVGELADKAVAKGFKWLVADVRFTPDQKALVDACHAKRVYCGVWEAYVDYGSPARTANGYDFYIGQVEGPGQYDRLVSSILEFRQAHPKLPAAVVTNFGGLETAALAKPLIDANFACIPEIWIKTDGVPPEQRVYYATHVLGWKTAQPMAGLGENGATMADYPTITNFPGHCIFSGESIL